MSDEEEVQKLATQAAKIAERLPEKFQEKCFEILFRSFLSDKGFGNQQPELEGTESRSVGGQTEKFMIPIDVRAFLQQHSVPEEALSKIFYTQGTEVRPTYEITTTKKATAQIQVSLLTALENALAGGGFNFSQEDIRHRCRDQRCYDSAHFKETFETNENLFKGLSDAEHVQLSPAGRTELAEVISEMTQDSIGRRAGAST